MDTTISTVMNNSDTPVAYVGKGGGGSTETGWAAWAFPGNSTNNFGWTVAKKYDQALLTMAGVFYIWDDGNWNIMIMQEDRQARVLVHIKATDPHKIEIQIADNGNPSGKQLEK